MNEDISSKTMKSLEQAREFAEVSDKEFFVKKKRVELQYDEIRRGEEILKKIEKIDFFEHNPERVQQVHDRFHDYLEAASRRLMFIDNDSFFNEVVPFFAKSLILIGATSGEGKSTCIANVVTGLIQTKKKAIIITNEEQEEDFCARILAIMSGKNFSNHDTLSEEDKEFYKKGVLALADHKIKIIDNTYNNIEYPTTSIEGLRSILESLKKAHREEGRMFDAILIDYYQNFSFSLNNPSAKEWENLKVTTEMLENFRKEVPMPIVLMCQIKSPSADEENQEPFKNRIEGGKSIFNRATCVLEIRADKKNLCTEWHVHKNRFNPASNGKVYRTGWDRGKYVPYDDAFKKKVQEWKNKQLERELNGLRKG
jgi:replicative DNA helicase